MLSNGKHYPSPLWKIDGLEVPRPHGLSCIPWYYEWEFYRSPLICCDLLLNTCLNQNSTRSTCVLFFDYVVHLSSIFSSSKVSQIHLLFLIDRVIYRFDIYLDWKVSRTQVIQIGICTTSKLVTQWYGGEKMFCFPLR